MVIYYILFFFWYLFILGVGLYTDRKTRGYLTIGIILQDLIISAIFAFVFILGIAYIIDQLRLPTKIASIFNRQFFKVKN